MINWIPLAEHLPPEDGPKVLVTNNMGARNAFGHMSHVWLVSMVHKIEPGEETIHGEDKLAKWGRFMAFSEFDNVIANLTHWADVGL